MALFPILLAVHIALAISVFLPSVLLPFALRTGSRPADGSPRRVTAGLLAMAAILLLTTLLAACLKLVIKVE